MKLEDFQKIPDSALDNVTLLTDEEIFETGENSTGDFNKVPDPDETEHEETEHETQTETDPESTSVGELITGEFAVDLMDAILPIAIVTAIHFLGYQLDKRELYLTARDKKVLAKATQRALNAVNVDLKNPFVNLAFVVSVIYGAKIIEQLPNIKKIDKKAIEIKAKDISDLRELAKPTDEQLFNDEFDKLADEVIKLGRRKTRSAAKKMLLKENLEAVNTLREKFGLTELEPESEREEFSL
jgi:hypothetical protein